MDCTEFNHFKSSPAGAMVARNGRTVCAGAGDGGVVCLGWRWRCEVHLEGRNREGRSGGVKDISSIIFIYAFVSTHQILS